MTKKLLAVAVLALAATLAESKSPRLHAFDTGPFVCEAMSVDYGIGIRCTAITANHLIGPLYRTFDLVPDGAFPDARVSFHQEWGGGGGSFHWYAECRPSQGIPGWECR